MDRLSIIGGLTLGVCLAQSPDVNRNPIGFERELSPGLSVVSTLQVPEGQFVQLIVRKKQVDLVLEVLDPAGKIVLTASNPNPSGPVPACWIAHLAGVYTLRVASPPRSPQTGHYRIELKALRPSVETDPVQIDAAAKFYAAAARQRAGNREGWLAAIELYQQAAAMWRGLLDNSNEALCLDNIGQLNSDLGEARKALDALQRAQDSVALG